MNIKSYNQAKNYLEQFIPSTSSKHQPYQLIRMRYFCNKINNPQNKYPIIHITGTSGKGSTAAFCSYILSELGLKTGLHTSPHLQTIRERFQINNKYITQKDFLKELNFLIPIISAMKNYQYGYPTYFEILTALAFNYFSHQKIDCAVIEVGLGGKLDATNIINPSTAIITNISCDHTDILGKTTKYILKDKMMIIKKNCPGAVSGIIQPKLRKILFNHCHKLNVDLKLINQDFKTENIQLALPGEFQKNNYKLAAEAVKIFVSHFFPKSINNLNLALVNAKSKTFIPGRFEIVKQKPLIILDGAHNRAKIKTLVKSVEIYFPKNFFLKGKRRFITVMAVKKGKSYETIIKTLQKITAVFIFTKFSQTTDSGFNLSTNPDQFKKVTDIKYHIEPNSFSAVKMAEKLSKELSLPILITGSLYLIGEVRGIWKKS